jgi:hypothetical protein
MSENSRINPHEEQGNDAVATPRTRNGIDEVRDSSPHPTNSFEETVSCDLFDQSRPPGNIKEGPAKCIQSKRQIISRMRKRVQRDSSKKSFKSDTSTDKEELSWYVRTDFETPEQSKMDAHVMSMVFFDTVEMQRSTMKSV